MDTQVDQSTVHPMLQIPYCQLHPTKHKTHEKIHHPRQMHLQLDLNQMCHCSDILQTQHHTLFECKTHFCHRHILGTGRACNIEVLLGLEQGIKRLARFLKAS